MRVLIVEDEVLIAMHLAMLVQELGHEVCAGATSSEALTEAAACLPDVALMDIQLANQTSGIDAARELYWRYNVRSIFLSANLNSVTTANVRACNPIDFVGKPVLPILLRRAPAKVIEASDV